MPNTNKLTFLNSIPRIKLWRPYCPNDWEAVESLIRPSSHLMFGKFHLKQIIELSAHRYVVENIDGNITACMCLRNQPNVPIETWNEFVSQKSSFHKLTHENTLFAHLMLWDERYNWEWFTCMLTTMYHSVFGLQYVIICVRPGSENVEGFMDALVGKYMHQIRSDAGFSGHQIYLSMRSVMLPLIKVRRAVIEDNDVLMKMLDETTPKLRERYGAYYLAEIIDTQSTRDVIVAEHNNNPIGMMSFNLNVNYDMLADHFDINTFVGLRRPFERSDGLLTSDTACQIIDKCKSDMIIERRLSSHESKNNLLLSSEIKSILLESKRYPSDCFLIELHAMRSDYDERFVQKLLQSSFEAYPDTTYCVISVPSVQRHIPLLSYFVRAIPKELQTKTCKNLYVLHRNAMLSIITVRPMNPAEDRPGISQLLQSLSIENQLAEHIQCEESRIFVIVMEGLIIGVCVTNYIYDMRMLMLNYEIRSFLNTKCHGSTNQACLLKMLVVFPAFAMRLPFIVTEILRLSDCTVMFYKLLVGTLTSEPVATNTMLSEMIPIWPRKRLAYDLDRLRPEQHPPRYVLANDEYSDQYALYAQTVSTCVKRKLHINHRIVVVGCSTTALAFLEHLIYSPDSDGVWFTQLTLISPMGLRASEIDVESELAEAFCGEEHYTPAHVRRLAFGTWVNVMHGKMTQINRKGKFVIVENEQRIGYDRLFILCGLQFDYPIKLQNPPDQTSNVAFVNNSLEAESLLNKIDKLSRSADKYNIIVYGNNLECYTCLYVLLKSNIQASCITYLRPRDQATLGTSTFNDNFIDDTMKAVLSRSGIQVRENCDITDWKIDDSGFVSKLTVESDLGDIEMPCTLLVCFERPIVPRRTIAVFNNSGLVFDARLVINENYQTSDADIYSAGPLSKFKRGLYADKWHHEFVSSREVGARLAQMTLVDLSPVRVRPTDQLLIGDSVLVYRQCRVIYRPVLGDYFYLCVRQPGRPLPYDLSRNMDNYGVDLITGNKETDGTTNMNYCRVHLNDYNHIETLMCLSKTKLDVLKYKAMWGHHEAMFSNLKMHFDQHVIQDLHEYFKMPWIYLIIHDHYTGELKPKNRKIMMEILKTDAKILKFMRNNTVQNKWLKMDEEQRLQFVEEFVMSSYDNTTNTNFIDFIVEHIDELPMFFDPNITKITFKRD